MNSKFPIEENNESEDNLGMLFKEQNKLSSEEKRRLWKKIDLSINRQKQKKLAKRYVQLALGCALLIMLTFGWFQTIDESTSMEKLLGNIEIGELTDVQLLLSEDNTILIADEESKIVYQEDGKVDIHSKEAIDLNSQHSEFNTLIVPYGKRSTITLQDGTKVWLNSGSKLVYPVSFTQKDRRVFLEGEGFFEVTRNEDMPFIVETAAMDIKVLGTAFNVTAFKNEPIVSAVLVEGSVKVTGNKRSKAKNNKTVLTPNERLVYRPETRETKVQKVNVERYISWKEGYLIYRQTNLNQVAKELNRYYNIDISFTDPGLALEKISGKLDLKQNAEEVIRIICNTSSLSYTKSERRFIIGKKV